MIRLTLCLWLMNALHLTAAEPPSLECKPLPSFDPSDWKAVELAFKDAAPIAMQQSWQKDLDATFKPSSIRTGWRGDSLWIYAEMQDVSILNPTTRLNEIHGFPADLKPGQWFDPIWTTRGDVFEIFLRKLTQEPYLELHITPQNQALQLRWKNAQDYMDNVREEGRQLSKRVIAAPQAFASRVLVDKKNGKWFVLAEIPSRILEKAGGISPGDVWCFSFCRYDFTQGSEIPILSSTSHHAMRGFHHQQEWGRLKFSR